MGTTELCKIIAESVATINRLYKAGQKHAAHAELIIALGHANVLRDRIASVKEKLGEDIKSTLL